MTSYALHPGALRDIEDIWEYIAEDDPIAADQVTAEFFEACAELGSFPNQGHWRDELAPRSIRFKTVRSYLIAYAPEPAPPKVLAVLHGRRSPRLMAAVLHGRSDGW